MCTASQMEKTNRNPVVQQLKLLNRNITTEEQCIAIHQYCFIPHIGVVVTDRWNTHRLSSEIILPLV